MEQVREKVGNDERRGPLGPRRSLLPTVQKTKNFACRFLCLSASSAPIKTFSDALSLFLRSQMLRRRARRRRPTSAGSPAPKWPTAAGSSSTRSAAATSTPCSRCSSPRPSSSWSSGRGGRLSVRHRGQLGSRRSIGSHGKAFFRYGPGRVAEPGRDRRQVPRVLHDSHAEQPHGPQDGAGQGDAGTYI